MASTSSQPNPLPRTLTLSESLFPPPEPWTPRTFTFNLSKVEHLPHGETKPLTWTAVDGESSLRFSIAARPYKVTLVRECTGEKIEELLGWTPLDFLAVQVSSIQYPTLLTKLARSSQSDSNQLSLSNQQLLVEHPSKDPSQSIVILTIQNKEKLREANLPLFSLFSPC